jgi:hypothetical protein
MICRLETTAGADKRGSVSQIALSCPICADLWIGWLGIVRRRDRLITIAVRG